MLKVAIGDAENGSLGVLAEQFDQRADIQVVDVCTKGRRAVELLRSGDVQAFLFPADWAKTCRVIRLSNPDYVHSFPSFIMADRAITKPLIVTSLLYGFHGVLQTTDEPDQMTARVAGIVDGDIALGHEDLITDLKIKPGLFARELVIDDSDDHELANLIGAGFTDAEIAILLDWTIQRVRNRIEHLIRSNGLDYRTQLAVLSSSVSRIPDFT